jgi:hypothetical protein
MEVLLDHWMKSEKCLYDPGPGAKLLFAIDGLSLLLNDRPLC